LSWKFGFSAGIGFWAIGGRATNAQKSISAWLVSDPLPPARHLLMLRPIGLALRGAALPLFQGESFAHKVLIESIRWWRVIFPAFPRRGGCAIN
jgi:hypothetical protein